MSDVSVEDLKDKADSLYRLVIVGARRANQLNKAESHSLLSRRNPKKPTIVALEEIRDGKLGYTTSADDEADFIE